MKMIETNGSEDIIIICMECDEEITDWNNIFEGQETSYICPYCEYEGYAHEENTFFDGKNVKEEREKKEKEEEQKNSKGE